MAMKNKKKKKRADSRKEKYELVSLKHGSLFVADTLKKGDSCHVWIYNRQINNYVADTTHKSTKLCTCKKNCVANSISSLAETRDRALRFFLGKWNS